MPIAVLFKDIAVAVPLQIVEVSGVAVIEGMGSTVTTAVIVALQLFATPVIVYVAVPAVLLLLLVNVWFIRVPLLAEPPVMPPVSTTVHE